MSDASYGLMQTPHGPWWFAWSPAGTFAAGPGDLAEDQFLTRLEALGVTPRRRDDRAERPDEIDLSRVSGSFRRRVLEACRRIPRGEVRTYAELARECGSPGAARAVGSAMAANPIPGPVPCHRVVRADGTLGEYSAGGTAKKRQMLIGEGVPVADGRVPVRSGE